MAGQRVVRRIAVVLAVYLLLALVGRHATAQREVFPFYSFDLFSRLPAPDEGAAAIWVHSLVDGPLPEPVPLAGSRHLRGSGVILANVARDLMVATHDDPERVAELAALVEANHLRPEVTGWSVRLEVRDLYARNPIDAVRSHPVAWFGEHPPAATMRWEGDALFDGGDELPLDRSAHGGLVEGIDEVEGGHVVRGWAGDPRRNLLPRAIVVLAGDEVILVRGVSVRRADVGNALGADRLRWSGFRLFTDHDPADLTLLAVFDDRVQHLGVAEGVEP